MNLSFLKLRVADRAWILFNARALANGVERRGGPDWSGVAAGVCDRYRGAAASGIVVVDEEGQGNSIRAWDSRGRPVCPEPAAILCASRWLFDAGRAGPDSVAMTCGRDAWEVLVIDSSTFGLAIGTPAHQDGTPVEGGSYGSRVAATLGAGIVVPVSVGSAMLDVTLFDRPPRRARRTSGRTGLPGGIEALVVSRQEVRVRRGRHDPVLASAASIAAAFIADYADREASVVVGGERLVVQWPDGGQVFVAAAPAYCLSGEFWTEDPGVAPPANTGAAGDQK